MKKYIMGLIALLLVGNVFAYGGGGGFMLPSELLNKIANYGKEKIVNDVWLISWLQQGDNKHKITKDGLAVKEINLVFDKRSYNKGGFHVIAKEETNTIAAFVIDTNIEENADFKHAEIYFEIPQEEINNFQEFVVIKDDNGSKDSIDAIHVKDNIYKIQVESFSEFEVIGVDRTQEPEPIQIPQVEEAKPELKEIVKEIEIEQIQENIDSITAEMQDAPKPKSKVPAAIFIGVFIIGVISLIYYGTSSKNKEL